MTASSPLALPFVPRRVFLFSGHRIDTPARRTPRFPPAQEAVAARCIAEALDAWEAGAGDLALAQGASGGDILFLEACRARGLHLQMLLPFDEAQFVECKILPSADGERWRERYQALKAGLASPPLVMPARPITLAHLIVPEGAGPCERCNLWSLDLALHWGADRLRFLCLWNGGGADGAGGTAHLYREAKRRGAQVVWLDTRSLW